MTHSRVPDVTQLKFAQLKLFNYPNLNKLLLLLLFRKTPATTSSTSSCYLLLLLRVLTKNQATQALFDLRCRLLVALPPEPGCQQIVTRLYWSAPCVSVWPAYSPLPSTRPNSLLIVKLSFCLCSQFCLFVFIFIDPSRVKSFLYQNCSWFHLVCLTERRKLWFSTLRLPPLLPCLTFNKNKNSADLIGNGLKSSVQKQHQPYYTSHTPDPETDTVQRLRGHPTCHHPQPILPPRSAWGTLRGPTRYT